MDYLSKEIIKTLEIIANRYNELNDNLIDPKVIEDTKLYLSLTKELNQIEEVVSSYKIFKERSLQLNQLEQQLNKESDFEFQQLIKEEVSFIEEELTKLALKIKELILPKDEFEERNVILEIRGAAGGEEANLFALDLLKIYQRWSDLNKWKLKLLDIHYSESGGASQLVVSIKGKGVVFGRIKFEAGVHRVQRVPTTETMGRVHTSTVTVTVIPEAPPESEIKIASEDIRVDTYRSSGAGGQSVNTTDSAVRITHLPTNTVVTCQQSRSQIENKELALEILRSKLLAIQEQESSKIESEFRRLAGSGARAEKIRTYNWSQDRVTDHRVAISSSLRGVLEGKIDVFIDALIAKEKAEKISKLSENKLANSR